MQTQANRHLSLNPVPDSIKNVLMDISKNVTFGEEPKISHPYYQPWELDQDRQEQFYRLPEEGRRYHLFKHLRTYIYGLYYNGTLKYFLSPKYKSGKSKVLRNDQLIGIDVDIVKQLQLNNSSLGYHDPNWVVTKFETDGAIAVTKNSLMIHIIASEHLAPQYHNCKIGDSVEVIMPKERFLDGFYMSIGNRGGQQACQKSPSIVRIYFNTTVNGSSLLMNKLTVRLNEMAIPFSFKLPYDSSNYYRYDTGVLYFSERDYLAVHQVLNGIYPLIKQYLEEETPLFTKAIAPGIGLAEEPNFHFENNDSFGLNRCHIITQALFKAYDDSVVDVEEKLDLITSEFNYFDVSLAKAFLNKNSLDNYPEITC
jgi:HopA1 effector protein family